MGKKVRAYFKSKNNISTDQPLKLLHMNLFSPSRTTILGENIYALVIVDDYSRYSWILFLS